jgi:uncharacterized protein YecE (DUF72 family)
VPPRITRRLLGAPRTVRTALVGCSGWSYADWREPVYGGLPPRRWLELYSEQFETVEVNSTFYRLPTVNAVRGWRDTTPEGFLFSVKASRYLTHIKRLAGLPEGIERLMDRLAPLVEAHKLGPILWQLPPSFHRDDVRLGRALEALDGRLHCFEFRHPSWYCPTVIDLLRQAGVGLVVPVHPDWPRDDQSRVTDWTYARFHYGTRGRAGNFSDAELEDWSGWVRTRSRSGQVYAYFNNDWNAFAVRNAKHLRRVAGSPAARLGTRSPGHR